tara:strand:+ start:2871 stop:3566 length:696 start_codon:yes stop_codon:yes gene_type:complete
MVDTNPQYFSRTTAVILGAGGLYLYRDEVSKNAKKLGNYALDNPFGTAVTLGVGSIVGMKALGLTTTDKWTKEAPYIPEPTSQQTSAMTSRAQAQKAITDNEVVIKANEDAIVEIDRKLVSGEGVSESQYVMLMQEKGQKQQQNDNLRRENAEHKRAISTANETIIPYRDKISNWYVKNGPLTTENRAAVSSLIFAAGGGYLVYNLLGEKKKFSYKGRSKRRPSMAFGFTA